MMIVTEIYMATLYPFQERVDTLIRLGRSIILQAPTGCGKTRAALFPFLDGWRNTATAFPRQCIYAVPMRVLANQFEAEYKQTVSRYATSHGLRKLGNVSIQTGARPEDPRFAGDLIFTTIDQLLSSFLTIPYSLSNRQANLNAGAIIGSYLVFDEFHLFPVDENGDGALATTLHMLKLLKGITPFVLMTATFSKTMIERLCAELDAEAVTLSQDEIDAIPSQRGKQRRYRYTAQSLTARVIADDFVEHRRQRVIAICNAVDRAQALVIALQTDAQLVGVQIELLHSRFYASDRAIKEALIQREFGEEIAQRKWGPAILVATQVVEVGLNITCEALHTEVAPASAIIQRAGRCARFAGESGLVLIYDVPQRDDGQWNFAPYLDPKHGKQDASTDETEGQSKLCERTLAAIMELPPEGRVLNYHAELELVNRAHAPFDEKLLERLHDNRHVLSSAVEAVLRKQDRSAARDLIRDIDSRTVIVHSDPTELTIPNPYRYEGIGIRRNALLGWYTRVQEQALILELDWVAKVAISEETSDPSDSEAAEQRRRMETRWFPLRPSSLKADVREACNALASAGLVALNPALVQYDSALGFRLDARVPAPNSPPADKSKAREDFGALRRETYAEHISGLYRVYRDGLRDRTAAVRQRLERHHGLPDGTLDRAIRLMFATHDLGKLDRRWQAWAHNWQARVSDLRHDNTLRIDADYMAAHTNYDSSDKTEWQANHAIRPKRPHHAAESARAGRDLIRAVAGTCEPLYTALMTAIICHHSAAIRADHDEWHPVPDAAKTAFNEAMRCVGLADDAELLAALKASGAKIEWRNGFVAAVGLSEDIIDMQRRDEIILYLLLARVLRLADQGSQEE
jgi:CRISPR-associated endonuclease/helicase Cas3